MASKEHPSPTDDQLRALFTNSMLYEITFAIGVPMHYPYDYCVWESVNFTRLGHARVLYKFFETPAAARQFACDVVSADFGFPARPNLITKDDWDRLNKDLFHLSYRRPRHKPEEKPWPPHLLGNLKEPVVDFMTHIRDTRQDLFVTASEFGGWCAVRDIIESGRVLEIASHFFQGQQSYTYHPGRTLHDGRPNYTEMRPIFSDGLAISCASPSPTIP